MVKDTWDSFKDNVKARITNPFLGTFVLVWIAHNWKVVYAFFYFDSNLNLQSRIEYFKNYWSNKNFVGNLFWVAIITICILIITYMFLAISRYLANVFENELTYSINRK